MLPAMVTFLPIQILFVIPGRVADASPESITTIVSMDSGPAPKKAHPGMTMVDGLLHAYTRNSRA
jgi:hypothetical protein